MLHQLGQKNATARGSELNRRHCGYQMQCDGGPELVEAATNVYLILDIKTALSRNSCVGVRLHLLLSWEPLGSQLLLNEHPTWGCSAWAPGSPAALSPPDAQQGSELPSFTEGTEGRSRMTQASEVTSWLKPNTENCRPQSWCEKAVSNRGRSGKQDSAFPCVRCCWWDPAGAGGPKEPCGCPSCRSGRWDFRRWCSRGECTSQIRALGAVLSSLGDQREEIICILCQVLLIVKGDLWRGKLCWHGGAKEAPESTECTSTACVSER